MDSQNLDQLQSFVQNKWQKEIIPELVEYIKIPAKSPAFDSHWAENKYIDKVVKQFKQWVLAQDITNLSLDVVELPNRTPLLFLEIPAYNTDNTKTILLYGHLDKQPEMTGWDEAKGMGPWQPVIIDNKLYGRGGADDGYAIFASVTAIKALQEQNLSHPRCVVIIEACEESGSQDLPYYIDHLKDKINKTDLVVCLDSGCGNYDQFWLTTSLRGLLQGKLTVEISTQGVHSGLASGIVPSSFRIARMLLSRLENEQTGEILPEVFYTPIPDTRVQEAEIAASVLQEQTYSEFPFLTQAEPVVKNNLELLLNRTWRPQLEITGADHLPKPEDAGNVLRPKTSLVLSMRLPPLLKASDAMANLKNLLEKDPPYNAKVTFEPEEKATGWNAPEMSDWLKNTVNKTSKLIFNKPVVSWGEGGTIPFMGMLGKKFPEAEFIITGVLGPKSNAHGPNEFLHLTMAEKLTSSIAYLINEYVKK